MDQDAIGPVAQRNESGSLLKSGSRVRISPGPQFAVLAQCKEHIGPNDEDAG
jgi:hypothetical protein